MWVYLIPKFIYPLNNISFCLSVFLTVLIAAERYLAVCHPITYRQTTVSRTRSERFGFYKNASDKMVELKAAEAKLNAVAGNTKDDQENRIKKEKNRN